MAAMEACGEALVVEPLLDKHRTAARLVSRGGSAAQRTAILPGVIGGSLKLAFACLEPGRALRARPGATRARAADGGWCSRARRPS